MTPLPNRDEQAGEGWIAWAGGQCPVSWDTNVVVKHRDGENGDPEIAGRIPGRWWEHDRKDTDVSNHIIAYRVVQS